MPLNVLRAGLRHAQLNTVLRQPTSAFTRMLGAHAVAQLEVVLVARPAAVAVVRAGREERAEHAVLHVKHRHVLVNRDLEPLRRRGSQQRFQLREVQVVGRRHALQPEPVL